MQPNRITDRGAAIRLLNDRLRTTGDGGQMVMTAGVANMTPELRATALTAVSAFQDFTVDNAPYGEHDCAVLTVGLARIIWKIDYCNLAMDAHSPDPSDPAVTCRVMTIMLAEEY